MAPNNPLMLWKALLLNPGATGAIVPSSRYLAKAMASYVPVPTQGLVVELGTGTGVITAALLKAGVPAAQIVGIEYAPHLARKLKKRFPTVNMMEGNAVELQALLQGQSQPVTTIISSLPLRSLPKEMSQAILEQISQLLVAGGRYIQFTYDIRGDYRYPALNSTLAQDTLHRTDQRKLSLVVTDWLRRPKQGETYCPAGWVLIHSEIVWRNLPPAKIEVFALEKRKAIPT